MSRRLVAFSLLSLASACVVKGESEPLGGVAALLGDPDGYTLDAKVESFDASCEDDHWTAAVGLPDDDIATRVVLLAWDLRTNDLWGPWELAYDGLGFWRGEIPASEIGIRCDGDLASTLLAIPFDGTQVGAAEGMGMRGAASACGLSSLGDTQMSLEVDGESDAATLRVSQLYAEDDTELVDMSLDEATWVGTTERFTWDATWALSPELGAWAELGGEPIASCAN